MLKDRKTNVVDLTTRNSELSPCFTFYLFTSGLLNDRHELSAIRFIVIAPNTVDELLQAFTLIAALSIDTHACVLDPILFHRNIRSFSTPSSWALAARDLCTGWSDNNTGDSAAIPGRKDPIRPVVVVGGRNRTRKACASCPDMPIGTRPSFWPVCSHHGCKRRVW
jgi:hypothetical protein